MHNKLGEDRTCSSGQIDTQTKKAKSKHAHHNAGRPTTLSSRMQRNKLEKKLILILIIILQYDIIIINLSNCQKSDNSNCNKHQSPQMDPRDELHIVLYTDGRSTVASIVNYSRHSPVSERPLSVRLQISS